MKSFVQTIAFCLMITMMITPTFATTHNVPGDFATIQAGLDISANGDTVLVQPGTYYENIVWPQVNGIKLIAAGDSSNTVVDADYSGRGITMSSDDLIDTTTVIHGFSIQGGYPGPGYSGGGFYFSRSSPTISSCRIRDNSTYEGSGGGLFIYRSNPTISNCEISDNHGDDGGGGITCYESHPIIMDCLISGNWVGGYTGGGGIQCLFGSCPLIINCVISNNTAELSGGGGIYCNHQSNPEIRNCTITGNVVDQWGDEGNGGGIRCVNSSPSVSNCTITENSANFGSGISCQGGSSISAITNCNITDNIGEGLHLVWGAGPVITFSNFYNNSEGNFGGEVYPDLGVKVGTNVHGDSCDVYYNISIDPRYVDQPNDDYHLQEGSPCIDAGDPDSPLDPDETIADIGAFYFDHNVRVWEDDLANLTDLPTQWAVLPAYPNPFNPSTTIGVSLPQPFELNVSVFNIAGQQVATLASGTYRAGSHALTFDASSLAGGMYFVHVSANGWSDVQKVILFR